MTEDFVMTTTTNSNNTDGNSVCNNNSGSGKLMFEENERILCFHGPLLYEAKVLKGEIWKGKSNPADDGPHYFIHYKGWKQTWDEWVPESRALKFNEENLKRQADLNESVNARKSKSSGGGGSEKRSGHQPDTSLASDKGSQKKRQREAADKEEEFLKLPEVKVPIPETLKIQLVDDWENITKNQKLVSIPRTPSVNMILKEYKDDMMSKLQGDSRQEDIVNEVVWGLRAYFNRALGNVLLYRFERPQYVEIKKAYPGKEYADIYGPEHLLRLFVQLPTLIAHTNMDQESITILKDQFILFLKYFEQRFQDFFASDYDSASPAYIALAQT